MIYDITQELFSSPVYPGDTAPRAICVQSMAAGDDINLTDLQLCAHNGTHMDAPSHFVKNGAGIDAVPLEKTVGRAEVIDASERERILASTADKLLLKGCDAIDVELANALIQKGIHLIGVEGQSVGDGSVHEILLSHEIAVLEGIRLSHVPEGSYFLFAAPLKLGGCEGAPCRAILMDGER